MTPGVSITRRVKAPVGDAWIARVIGAALRGASVKSSREVGVVFVGDREMASLNAAYRGKKKTTDVLSFGNDGAWAGKGNAGWLGDLIVSVPQVRRQAASAKKPLRNEIALMLVHGTLHLLGYDHATVREEKSMFRLQGRILQKLGYA